MKVWMMHELLQLSRSQLLELSQSIAGQLDLLLEGSIDHSVAVDNLDKIRTVLSRPVFTPRRQGYMPPAP